MANIPTSRTYINKIVSLIGEITFDGQLLSSYTPAIVIDYEASEVTTPNTQVNISQLNQTIEFLENGQSNLVHNMRITIYTNFNTSVKTAQDNSDYLVEYIVKKLVLNGSDPAWVSGQLDVNTFQDGGRTQEDNSSYYIRDVAFQIVERIPIDA